MSALPLLAGFPQLDNKLLTRRLPRIRGGRAHVTGSLTKLPQCCIAHLHQALAQGFNVKMVARSRGAVGRTWPLALRIPQPVPYLRKPRTPSSLVQFCPLPPIAIAAKQREDRSVQ